jgi:tetratricopeptide (TPR) repeat protein
MMTAFAEPLVCSLLMTVVASACSTKKGEPAPSKEPWVSATAPAKASDPWEPAKSAKEKKEAPPEVPVEKRWRWLSEKNALMCGQLESPEDGDPASLYKNALKIGRKEAAARRWGDAAVAFEVANKQRAGKDPTALSELSWAQLQSGDYDLALEAAKKASAASKDPKQKAGALYNAGRAAESMGQLDEARGFYESAVALRGNPAITERIVKLAAPVPREAEVLPLMSECQDQPSPEAACECLGKAAASWGKGGKAEATCTLEKAPGEHGAFASVVVKPEREDLVPGRSLVLIAKRGATWSALRIVEASSDIDLAETPRMSESAEITRYDELPYRDGVLYWIESKREQEESGAGEHDLQGSSRLTLCALPDGKARSCTHWVRGEWSYVEQMFPSEGAEACQSRELALYYVMMDATGKVNVTLDSGVDKKGLVGEYAL